MIRQDDKRIDGKGAGALCRGHSIAQAVYFIDQQGRAALRQSNGKEHGGTGNSGAVIV